MEVSIPKAAAGRFSVWLAGLQAGMLAALWMLAWLGSTSVWQRRSFWTAENLLASTFYGGSAVRQGFSTSTVSGLALYLLVYSVLGCLFAAAVRLKLAPMRLLLVSIGVALGWYYLSFHVLWKSLSPLIPLLHAVRPTILGHVIYGAVVARFPRYLHTGFAGAAEAALMAASAPGGEETTPAP
ncbi:MAG: hypothetical protein C5B51_04800 [Terriglobia bacterium]|nr:MAG: hypothetical protein C5B51_04800 [Terriglobia bacterium]